jgi:hypothetical protein
MSSSSASSLANFDFSSAEQREDGVKRVQLAKIYVLFKFREIFKMVKTSVADPDPEDPYVFGPPGYGSVSQRYGSRSGSSIIEKK